MDEDKQVEPEVVMIDDLEFDDEFNDLFDELGDILSTEAKESCTIEETQIIPKPNEPIDQNVGVETQVLAEATKTTDITSLAKSVFDALQTMKQTQSGVAENPVQDDDTSVVKDTETDYIPISDSEFVHQRDIGADDYKLLKEKYKKTMKRHKKVKGSLHKERKNKGHKIKSDEYKRDKLLKQISLLDSALYRKQLQEEREAEMEAQEQERLSKSKKNPHTRPENTRSSSYYVDGEEFYEGHWTRYVEPPAVISSFDLRNKLRLSAKRALDNQTRNQDIFDHVENDEFKHNKNGKTGRQLVKSKIHKNYRSEEVKSLKVPGSSKPKSVCVSSSDDVLKKDKHVAKEDVEPVSSSTSVRRKANKVGSRRSSTSSVTTISVVHMDSTEGEIITSAEGIVPVQKRKNRKKTSVSKSEKKSKTENNAVEKKAKLKTTMVLEEPKNRLPSPQTYEVFDIAPFESSNLDIEIISENIVSQTVDTTQFINTKQAMEMVKNITPLVVLDSPGRDSVDSITSAKTVRRSRSIESLASNELGTTETLDNVEKSPHLSSPDRDKSPANSERTSLSDISPSPLCSDSSSSKHLHRSENSLLKGKFDPRYVRSAEDPNDDRSQSPHSTNGSLPSSPEPESHTRKISQSPRHREEFQCFPRGKSSDETRPTYRERKDEARYREKWRDSPTTRRAYRSSNSPPRRRSRTPLRNVRHHRHGESAGTSTCVSYHRKTSGSRSPHYKRCRSPYRDRSRSRSRERYKKLRAPYRKRSRSKSPHRRQASRPLYRKTYASPKSRKSRSPYKLPLKSKSGYRRSLSTSPVRKIRKSKSPLQKRFEAAVAKFMPQLEQNVGTPPTSSAKALMDGYEANSASFTMTSTRVQQVYRSHGPPLQHNNPYSQPHPQQPLSYGPPMGGDYPVPTRAPYPTYNLTWIRPQGPEHQPMAQMPYNIANIQMSLPPPGVAPYPNVEQPPGNTSFPAPIPVPSQPPMMMATLNNTSFPLPAPVHNQPPMMPTMPPQSSSYPLPVATPKQPNQPSTFLPPVLASPPFVLGPQPTQVHPSASVVGPPDSGGQIAGATNKLVTTCATSQTASAEPCDKPPDFYSPSNSPPNSPVKFLSPFSSRALNANAPSIRLDMTEFMTESSTDTVSVTNERTDSPYSKEIIHSPIILRLKKNLSSLISSKSPEVGNSNDSNQTPTGRDSNSVLPVSHQVVGKLMPTNGRNSSKHLAIPIIGTASKVIKKISFPVKANIPNIIKSNVANKAFDLSEPDALASSNNDTASTRAENKPDDSIAIPVCVRNQTSNNLLSKNKNTRGNSSNRIIVATTDFPCQTANKPKERQTNVSNNCQSLSQSQVLEQVTKFLSISKRSASTQVSLIDDSLQGSDEVFETETGGHENLLNTLTRLLQSCNTEKSKK